MLKPGIKKAFLFLKAGGLILLPIVLIILPAGFFDNGQSVCLSVLLFHRKCFACGMTRGVQHLIHFDFKAAWEFNKLAVIVTPLLLVLLGEELIKTRRQLKKIDETDNNPNTTVTDNNKEDKKA